MTNLWGSIELRLEDTLEQHVKMVGINNGDKLVNTLMLATKLFIYIKHKTNVQLSLSQVKEGLFNEIRRVDSFSRKGKKLQMIYESLFNFTYSHISTYIMLSFVLLHVCQNTRDLFVCIMTYSLYKILIFNDTD